MRWAIESMGAYSVLARSRKGLQRRQQRLFLLLLWMERPGTECLKPFLSLLLPVCKDVPLIVVGSQSSLAVMASWSLLRVKHAGDSH